VVQKNSFCFNGCLSDSLAGRTWIFEICVNNIDEDTSSELSATRNLNSAVNFNVMSVVDGENLPHEISGLTPC